MRLQGGGERTMGGDCSAEGGTREGRVRGTLGTIGFIARLAPIPPYCALFSALCSPSTTPSSPAALRVVSGTYVMDELPDGCAPTGLALSKDGNLVLLAVSGGYLFSWDFSALNPRPRHSGMVLYSDEDQPRLCSDLVRATCKPETQTTWGPYMRRGDPATERYRAGRLGPQLG